MVSRPTTESKGLKMMKRLFKAALIAVTLTGFQAIAVTGASAETGTSGTNLLQYAMDPDARTANLFKPFKVASRRSRRRNRGIAGGVIAAGIAGLIISEAIRSKRRDRYYDDDRYYSHRSSYPGRRTCRKWARSCDYGSRRSCRKWNNRCR
jgi:hypothetical protein